VIVLKNVDFRRESKEFYVEALRSGWGKGQKRHFKNGG
jgi:hypothetical protein